MKYRMPLWVFRVLIFLGFFLGVASVSYSEYTVIQITDNDYQDLFGDLVHLAITQIPRVISDNGEVVWTANGVTGSNIFFWDGQFPPEDHITQISGSGNAHCNIGPSINNHGQVVWGGGDPYPEGLLDEIFFWDGQFPPEDHITQITNDSVRDEEPHISNNGYVVWRRYDSDNVYVYDGITRTQLSLTHGWFYRINDNGQVVWQENRWGLGAEIFFWDGQFPPEDHTTQITNNSNLAGPPQINDSGQIVWVENTGAGTTLFFWDGQFPPEDHITQITNGTYDEFAPQINNNGQVVWNGGESYHEIFFWDGQFPPEDHITQIPHDSLLAYHGPQMNDDGHVVWTGTDSSRIISNIFIYDGITTNQLTNNSYDHFFPQINDKGHVVWFGDDGTDWEIFIAVPDASCIDNDSDGYGNPAHAECPHPELDCNNSNPHIYPTNSNTYCDCAEPYPQGVSEICEDGIDNNCDGLVDNCGGSCVGSLVEASTYDPSPAIESSDLAKHLAYILLQLGAVIGLMIWCRRR